MKKAIIIASLALGLFMSSCEGFLDLYPHSAVAMDEAIQTEADVEVAVNGVYSAIKSDAYYGRYFVVYGDVMTDEVASVMGFSNQLGILYRWLHTATDNDVEVMWQTMYVAISRANIVINSVGGIQGNAANLNYYKGEALMARALVHFDLLRMFAKAYDPATASTDLGVPYMKAFEISEPPRATIETVYTNIIADLKEAAGLMKTSPRTGALVDRYFSEAAANALLARVYLYKEDWENAKKYSEMVIANSNYALENGAGFKNMWLNDVGDEVIWKVGLTVNDASNRYIGYNYYNDSQGDPNPDYMPTDNFLALYDAVNDTRYDSYFNYVKTKTGDSLTLVYKYPTNPEFASTTNANGVNMPKVLRLAEMYLISAEAYAELNKTDSAWMRIQDLRINRITAYNPAADPKPAAIKDEIFKERKRELAFEGHLFFDYKRKGLGFTRQGRTAAGNNRMANDVSDLTVSPNHVKWLYPIPQNELNANSGMAAQSNKGQNPGY